MTTQPPQRGNSPLGFPDFKTGLAITQAFMGLFSQTIEVFFRRDFGERYFSLFGVYGTVATYGVFFLAISLLPGKRTTAFFRLFLFASLIMFVVHQVAIWQRNRKGIRWHSRYPGTSRLVALLPKLDPYIIGRYIEPLVSIVIGYIIANFIDPLLGFWLIFAGLCLATTEAIAAARYRNMILDTIDAQIEAKQLRDAVVEKKGAEATEGFIFPVAPRFNQYRQPLFSGLKKFYEAEPESSPAAHPATPAPHQEQRPKSDYTPPPDFG